MPISLTLSIQDTTVVAVARDGLGLASAWMTFGMGVAFVAILVVLIFVLAELRHLSRAWSGFWPSPPTGRSRSWSMRTTQPGTLTTSRKSHGRRSTV